MFLRNILYYVVFLLNKEITVNKDLEEFCSNVVELMSSGDGEKEYKRATKVAETKENSLRLPLDFTPSPLRKATYKHYPRKQQ